MEFRAFLGLASFYRKLVDKFRAEAKPLKELMKDRSFIWGPEQQKAFESLEDKSCKAPVLAFPTSAYRLTSRRTHRKPQSSPFCQIQNGVQIPFSYASRQLNKAEQSYSASERDASVRVGYEAISLLPVR
jgi:hypothetical protein